MHRQRGELVPIGEVVSGLDDAPAPALREVSPQARHHFTQADQVNQLVGASETDSDLGFMARLMALCSLPRTNLGNRLQYKRVNGPYKLVMIAGADNKLPYGNLPRLLVAWVCTEAVRTQSRELVLGSSLSEFMGKLGMDSIGGDRTRLRNQMRRLFREVEFALPRELNEGDQVELAREFASKLANADGERLPYTLAVHRGKGENPHVHLMISERVNDGIERSAEQWFRRYNGKEPEKGGGARAWQRGRRIGWSRPARIGPIMRTRRWSGRGAGSGLPERAWSSSTGTPWRPVTSARPRG